MPETMTRLNLRAHSKHSDALFSGSGAKLTTIKIQALEQLRNLSRQV